MRKLFLLLIVLLIAYPSYSQVGKTQDAIIFANNDTIVAEIKDEQLHFIQTRIQYKLPGSNNFVTVLPDLIKSVKFEDGRQFETLKTDSVSFLLLRLVEGFYDLYTKIEGNGLNTYYIRHAQDRPIHLVETFTDKYVQEDGKFHSRSNFEYAHQLIVAMADNVSITKEINVTKFREVELVSVVKHYNEFKGNKYPESANRKKKVKISTGILIDYYPLLTEFQSAGFGMSFDFYRNRPYQRFGLMTRLAFNFLEYTKNDSYTFGIKVPVALSYKYLESTRLKLYCLGGFTSFIFIDSQTSYGHRRTSVYGGPLPYIGTGIDYKIKKSALRFEISLLPLNFILGYIF